MAADAGLTHLRPQRLTRTPRLGPVPTVGVYDVGRVPCAPSCPSGHGGRRSLT